MAASEMKFREEAQERCLVPHFELKQHHLEDEPAVSGSRVPPRLKDERGRLLP